jgi:hypothetical protein
VKGSVSLELSSAFVEGEIYEEQKTTLEKYILSHSLFRAVSGRKMRWRRENEEEVKKKSFSVMDSFTNDCRLLASRKSQCSRPEKLTFLNCPKSSPTCHARLSWRLAHSEGCGALDCPHL